MCCFVCLGAFCESAFCCCVFVFVCCFLCVIVCFVFVCMCCGCLLLLFVGCCLCFGGILLVCGLSHLCAWFCWCLVSVLSSVFFFGFVILRVLWLCLCVGCCLCFVSIHGVLLWAADYYDCVRSCYWLVYGFVYLVVLVLCWVFVGLLFCCGLLFN